MEPEPWDWIPHEEGADRQKEINACLRKLVDGMPLAKPRPAMSDTPRTDALLLEINEGRVYKDNGPRADLCRQLERELKAAKSDAERYRWIRSSPSTVRRLAMLSDDALDAAVDAAMQEAADST